MRKLCVPGIIFFAAVMTAGAQGIRPAVWAGQFYDRDPVNLSAQIDSFLRIAPAPVSDKPVKGIIVPHAGYAYSGQVAACGYRLVQGQPIDSVVIIGPSHRFGFRGCSIYTKGGFETPLGIVAVDEILAAEIAKASGFGFVPEAHVQEHSIEVQVPFIQKTLPRAKIVPIIMGSQDERTINRLASALAKTLPGRNTLAVASTDMSHFLSKEEAARTDSETLSLISSYKLTALINRVERGENILCGGGPAAAAMIYVQKCGKARAEILKYADSSGFGGPIVGYMSAVLTADESEPGSGFQLTGADKRDLLRLARSAVTRYIEDKETPQCPDGGPNLKVPRGAFVTLKKKGALRGCVGFIEPVAPLCQTIIQCAVYAAVEDRRFPPVAREELQDLEYEISVLTPLEPVSDPSSIKVGKHGLVVTQNGRKGLLLPQVAVENRWSRNEFLAQTCLKAGLPADAWKKGAKLQTFEAVVFP